MEPLVVYYNYKGRSHHSRLESMAKVLAVVEELPVGHQKIVGMVNVAGPAVAEALVVPQTIVEKALVAGLEVEEGHL